LRNSEDSRARLAAEADRRQHDRLVARSRDLLTPFGRINTDGRGWNGHGCGLGTAGDIRKTTDGADGTPNLLSRHESA
jgi:hypothetical protein